MKEHTKILRYLLDRRWLPDESRRDWLVAPGGERFVDLADGIWRLRVYRDGSHIWRDVAEGETLDGLVTALEAM